MVSICNFTFANYCFLDMYISMVSSAHAVCAEGLYVATISTLVESDQPEQEIQPAI